MKRSHTSKHCPIAIYSTSAILLGKALEITGIERLQGGACSSMYVRGTRVYNMHLKRKCNERWLRYLRWLDRGIVTLYTLERILLPGNFTAVTVVLFKPSDPYQQASILLNFLNNAENSRSTNSRKVKGSLLLYSLQRFQPTTQRYIKDNDTNL